MASGSGSPPSFGEGPGVRSGDALAELPLKQYDHALDATRYALHTALACARATDVWVELFLTRRRG